MVHFVDVCVKKRLASVSVKQFLWYQKFFLHHTTQYVNILHFKESTQTHWCIVNAVYKIEMLPIRVTGSHDCLHPLLPFIPTCTCSCGLVPFASTHAFCAQSNSLLPFVPFMPTCAPILSSLHCTF